MSGTTGRMPEITAEEMERRGARSRTSVPRLSLGWQEHADCRDEDVNLFFPLGTGEDHAEQIEKAKQVCRRCPVRQQCLEYALTLGIKHGIFGGLDEDERGKLRRRQSRRAA